MKLNKYVILRLSSNAALRFTDDSLKSRSAVVGIGQSLTDEIKFETADLTKKEIDDLSRDRDVKSIAPNIPMKLYEPVEKEDLISSQKDIATWGIEAVGADKSPFTGHGVTVAVLDTGIDSGHVAFNGIEVIQKDFTGEGNGDDNGHGTHVAGTVFGRTVDGTRIGIASGIEKALVGKVLSATGGGTTSMITDAIQWALQSGANIISMSLGMDFPGYVDQLVGLGYPADLATSVALEGYRANLNLFNTMGTLVQSLGEFLQPAIIVAAAGNESRREIDPNYEIAVAPPAAAEGILAVGALGQKDDHLAVAQFSNSKPDISGPGVDIISARSGGGLRRLSGTSMATPHVAGVAALWAEKLTDTGLLTSKNLAAKLISSATLEGLVENSDLLDVGMGIIQAPMV